MNPVLGVAFDPPVVLTVVVPGFGLNLNSKCLRAPSWILPTVNSRVLGSGVSSCPTSLTTSP